MQGPHNIAPEAAFNANSERHCTGITAAQIREHYDSLALIYRAFWGDHLHHGLFLRGDECPEQAQVKLVEFCAELAGLERASRVLDVGCGSGGTAWVLARHYGCCVEGFTLSEKQARLARERARAEGLESNLAFWVADVENFVFPRHRYDLVWTMEASEHFADKSAYFQRVSGALAAKGKLMLAAWTGSMQNARVRAVAQAFLCPSIQTEDEYRRQMERAGMSVVAAADLTCKVTRTWEICCRRAAQMRAVVPLLPRAVRDFVAGLPVILEAYQSGALGYSVLVASK